MIRRGSAKKLHASRVAWLAPRLTNYAAVPGINEDVNDAGRVALDTMVRDFDAAGLLGGSSIEIQREVLRRLLSEFRGELVRQGHW